MYICSCLKEPPKSLVSLTCQIHSTTRCLQFQSLPGFSHLHLILRWSFMMYERFPDQDTPQLQSSVVRRNQKGQNCVLLRSRHPVSNPTSCSKVSSEEKVLYWSPSIGFFQPLVRRFPFPFFPSSQGQEDDCDSNKSKQAVQEDVQVK